VQGAKEKVFITAYPATNSLIINAPPEDMRDIERIIREIDTLRPQVLVEAAIIEVSTTRGDEFGVEWLAGATTSDGKGAVGGFVQKGGPLTSVGAAIASGEPGAVANALPGGLNIGVLGGNITFNGKTYPSVAAFIRALTTVDKVNILSTPQLLTKDNEEAEIIIGENRPYLTSTRLDASGNPIYSYDYRDVGVKLKIKPQINNDGYVYLNLYQEVSKVTDETTGGVIAPTTLKRSTKTTVVVKDSQTVVISGLIQDDSTGSEQGIPFLRSLPLIGRLFGYNKTTHDKTNLLVFLTPRIIYTADTLQTISDKKKQDQDRMIKRNRE
jgi:general secretion pathway protein D